MKSKLLLIAAVAVGLALCGNWILAQPSPEILRGWISDEQCARGRAEGGSFTATNADCAHKCVAAGKKVVFIDPVGKRVLTLEDQSAAKKNLGNYVEISGTVDASKGTLHADSVKFLDKARPMCGVPEKHSK
jgi:hypothetical protein